MLSFLACSNDLFELTLCREREAQASLLASSIEGNASSKAQTELENASDEEEKFSAVVRPNHESRDRRDARDFRDFNSRPERGAISGTGAGSASVNTGGGVNSQSITKEILN